MKTSPKDFFLHLGVIASLYVGAGGLINLVFTIIEKVFPSQTIYVNYYDYSPISLPVAILIVILPIFITLSWLLNKDYRISPEKRVLGSRRWLIFLTLFVSGGVIAGDLIFLLYTFLTGEIITTGFIIKAAFVLVLAGSIFSYYISDLRDKTNANRNRIYAIALGILVLGLIVWGFAIFGSPYTQRKLRADAQKISDLQRIQYEIVNYWQQKYVLPPNLGALVDPISGFVVPKDSETGKAYEYRQIADKKFELCAVFNLESSDAQYPTAMIDPAAPVSYPEKIGVTNEIWKHAAGRACFERTIDPELYPPRKV